MWPQRYPAEYPEQKLAGKTVDYTIEVKGIKKRNLPDLTDEFAKEVGSFESAGGSGKPRSREPGQPEAALVEGETKDRLFAALIERFPFPVPETLVQEQIDARLERGLRALAAQGMEPDQMRKLDFRPVARGAARQRRSRGEEFAAAGEDCQRRERSGQR